MLFSRTSAAQMALTEQGAGVWACSVSLPQVRSPCGAAGRVTAVVRQPILSQVTRGSRAMGQPRPLTHSHRGGRPHLWKPVQW